MSMISEQLHELLRALEESAPLETSAGGSASLSEDQSLALSEVTDTEALCRTARTLRDRAHGDLISYSRKVFLPLTHLCRDICHYCIFAQPPKPGEAAYMSPEDVLSAARDAAAAGCKEALFTLGDQPELRWSAAREGLRELGHTTTLEYLAEMAARVHAETGLLPHLNPGLLSAADFAALRPTGPSMGIMLESVSSRLMEKGEAHYGCPDKDPERRLATLEAAGEAAVPFTSGILIGIGETRRERIEALLALRALHNRYGHIQEVIVQNFRAKPETRMANHPEPSLDDLLWTIAVARLVLGAEMNIQAPPNLSPGALGRLVDAGLNDWGGVSPVTPDFVNPEAPWPHLDRLAEETRRAGKILVERLTIYPRYVQNLERWVDKGLHTTVLRASDAQGFARDSRWSPGEGHLPPPELVSSATHMSEAPALVSSSGRALAKAIDAAGSGRELSEQAVVRLLTARGDHFAATVQAADRLRRATVGDTVRYVVNRNINYTNVCYFKCRFCAFSKGKQSLNLRGKPYDLGLDEIARRCEEAWSRGATEVCMQGGIHPQYTGKTYLDTCRAVKGVTPDMHIHAFSPLEVWQGAATLGVSLADFLAQLREAGLGTLPGTAAEILDDEVRRVLCADKIRSEQWLEVMRTAHGLGIRTTATIMYGHIERPEHQARHILRIRRLQDETGGFTEFVPLPFVAMEAPIYLEGRARRGPTFREAVALHAAARLALHPVIENIQASWVKMGPAGVAACLDAGANDLGGTLMNESITRAAGAEFGEELPPEDMDRLITSLGRQAEQRTTLYDSPSREQQNASYGARTLTPLVLPTPRRRESDEPSGQRAGHHLIRPGIDGAGESTDGAVDG